MPENDKGELVETASAEYARAVYAFYLEWNENNIEAPERRGDKDFDFNVISDEFDRLVVEWDKQGGPPLKNRHWQWSRGEDVSLDVPDDTPPPLPHDPIW